MTDKTKNGPQSPVAPKPLLKVAGRPVEGQRVRRTPGKRTGYHRRRLKTQPLIIAAWNVRTLLDRKGSNRPERRSALVTRELQRYNVDIAALSETRFLDAGELSEVGSGYTLYRSKLGVREMGRGREGRR